MSESVQPQLSHLVELQARLRADESAERASLYRRDRDVARTLSERLRSRPDWQLVGWLRRTRPPGDTLRHRVAGGVRVVSVVLAVLGFALGWGIAAALFYYDGSTPVNVVNVLAVFVGAQLLLLVPLLVMLLPAGVPGVAAVQETVALLSPGRLWRLATPLLPQEARERLDEVLGLGAAHGQVYGRVQKWALLRWSQLFAVALNLGALLRFVQLIVFTDVAFAWSTTLAIEDGVVYEITRVLALPWSWAWPEAAPSAEFVSRTRFFRPQVLTDPASFGGWWPFILMCMLVYGLLPRVVTLLVAQWRLRRAISWALVHTPGAEAVLDRMNNEYVETRALDAEASEAAVVIDAAPAPAPVPRSVRAIVNWAEVPLGDEALRKLLGAADAPVLHCGGARGLEEDGRAIASLRGGDNGGGVVVATKSWEPPMLEVVDFLGDLRRALGPGVSVTLTPLALDGSGRVTEPSATHLAQWQRKAKSAGDAWVSVATVSQPLERSAP